MVLIVGIRYQPLKTLSTHPPLKLLKNNIFHCICHMKQIPVENFFGGTFLGGVRWGVRFTLGY